jgi:iron complex transport system substrate-binding protein
VTRRLGAALLALAALAGAACTAGSASTEGGSLGAVEAAADPRLPVTVSSADGRQVTVADISRIVSLWGNVTETVFALGLGDHVVGRDIATTFAEARDLPVVARGHDVSAESVLSLRPTLVLASVDSGPPEAIDQIRNVGIPVLVLRNPERVEDLRERIHEIAAALGVPEAGDRVAAEAQAQLRQVQRRIPDDVDRPKVAFLYVRGQAGVYLLGGPGSGADSMIAAAGGIDAGTAAGFARDFTPMTSEALVREAPDALLLTTTGLASVGGVEGLLEIPGVAQTPAGRARRIVTLEDGLLFSFGSRTPDALRALIEQLYGAG